MKRFWAIAALLLALLPAAQPALGAALLSGSGSAACARHCGHMRQMAMEMHSACALPAGAAQLRCPMVCCLEPAPQLPTPAYDAPSRAPAELPLAVVAMPAATAAPVLRADTGDAAPPGVKRHILLEVFRN